jgi:predicted O-methyltransferase YrrM
VIKGKDGKNQWNYISSSKPSIQFVLNRLDLGQELVVAEVGVWKGENAKHMLEVLPIKKLYAIDMWKPFCSSSHDAKTMLTAEDATRYKLRNYYQVEILKMSSDEAVKLLPNNMDFIYIDGDHDYEFVKKDIENYYKKLRKGGVLAGDDISNRKIPNGVFKALAEFAVKNKIEVTIDRNDWMVIRK